MNRTKSALFGLLAAPHAPLHPPWQQPTSTYFLKPQAGRASMLHPHGKTKRDYGRDQIHQPASGVYPHKIVHHRCNSGGGQHRYEKQEHPIQHQHTRGGRLQKHKTEHSTLARQKQVQRNTSKLPLEDLRETSRGVTSDLTLPPRNSRLVERTSMRKGFCEHHAVIPAKNRRSPHHAFTTLIHEGCCRIEAETARRWLYV